VADQRRIMMTDFEELVVELKKLNKTLERLTDEHITHFNEWRAKNNE
jgi:hypothetical protein